MSNIILASDVYSKSAKFVAEFFSPEENVKLEPNLQKGGNDFLYVESKRARQEREKVVSANIYLVF